MPALINPTAIPLPKSFPPPPVIQHAPWGGPAVRQPIPSPGRQTGSVPVCSYLDYRRRLSELATLVQGFRGSADWNTCFVVGCAFDNRIKSLLPYATPSTGNGSTPPQNYVLLESYLPSYALKSVSWVAGAQITMLWISTTPPNQNPPGPLPKPWPVHVPGSPNPGSGSSTGTSGAPSGSPFGPVVIP